MSLPQEEFHSLAYYAEERLIVEVVRRSAFMSKIRYSIDGLEITTYVDNTDLLFLDDGIGYELDE